MMARIRTVKPEFWSSEQVMSCRPLSRLLFIGLWNFCDDGGNHPLSPRTIKALVFPGDDITTDEVSELLGELEGSNLTASYTVAGKVYVHVLGWKHQKIEKKNFKYPPFPTEFDDQSESGRRQFAEESSTGSRPVDPGMEGNGRDKHHSLPASGTFEGFADLEDPLPEEVPPPVDPKAPVEMTLDWMPDANLLKTYCAHFGVSESIFTKEAVAPFTAHHETEGSLNTQAKWVSLLVRWVKGDKAKASNVRPFPVRRQTTEPDFESTAWAEGLVVTP